MANRPILSTSHNPSTVRPVIPGDFPEKSIVPEPSNQPVLRSVAYDKNSLPLDVFELIFEHFIPHSSTSRHRYDAAPFSVIYQPTFITFARLSETCKAFQDLVTYFRFKNKLIEFRKQGSRLEFDNMLRRTNKTGQSDTRAKVQTTDASSTSTTSTSSKTTSARLTASSSATTSNTIALQSIEDMRKIAGFATGSTRWFLAWHTPRNGRWCISSWVHPTWRLPN